MKRYLLLPFHSTPLVLVATFSAGLLLAAYAGFMGIPLGLVLLSWFFKYCFIVLDSIVAGEDEPPVLSIEMVNPVSEQRPLALALLIIGEAALVTALRNHVGHAVGFGAIVILTWILPANIAVLAVLRNPFLAVWPPSLHSLIKGLGRDYLLLNAVTLAAAGIVYWMATHRVSAGLALVAIQISFLLMFALVGGTIFEHRHELGLESRTRRERTAERDTREHQSERHRMLDAAYSRFRARKPLEGWQEIETWLRQHAHGDNQIVEYRAVLEAASEWDDVRPGDRLANDFVAILLAKRANGEALDVVEQRLATHPEFQLASPAHAIRIAELAGAAGKRSLQRRVTPSG